MTISKFTKLISAILLLTTYGCIQSEYNRLVRSELSKEGRQDSVLLGINLTDSKQEFMDKCTDLNKKQLVTMGPRGSVLYVHEDSVFTEDAIRLMMFPKYDDLERISDIDIECSFSKWAPWNESYQSDKLESRLIELFMQWYGGNNFIYIEIDKMKVPIKIDNNRRIVLKRKDTQTIVAMIHDLSNNKFLGEKIN